MPRLGFTMKLFKGKEEEYHRRHAQIWPELQSLLKISGISEYSIFLDRSTGTLFGVLNIEDALLLDELPKEPVMQRWWNYMADIMETNSDKSPASLPLEEMFYLP